MESWLLTIRRDTCLTLAAIPLAVEMIEVGVL
jgi:hypothetical protein